MKAIFDLVSKQVRVLSESNQVKGIYLTRIDEIEIKADYVRLSGCMIDRKISHQEMCDFLEKGYVTFTSNCGSNVKVEIVE